MEYRKSGSSDLFLSVIGLGCWSFGGGDYWGKQDQKDVDEVVHAAVEDGVNFFDTAEIYNDGRSESSLGKAIKGLKRDKLIIGTKVSPSNCYPGILEEHCNESLRRLDTDYIDVYMIHWPLNTQSVRFFTKDESIINNPPGIGEAFRSLIRLREAGKIRYIGVSNFSKQRMMQDFPPDAGVAINELPYNLLSRAIEFETLPYCESSGIGVLGYITLMQGILSGKYQTLSEIPQLLTRTRHFNSANNPKSRHGGTGYETEVLGILNAIRAIGQKTGLTMTELSAGWVSANKSITCSLMGARNIDQLKANVEAVRKPLPKEITDQLNIISEELKNSMGTCFDYYENREKDRTI